METVDTIAQRALDEPRLTLDDLARATGASRAALEKYRMLDRAMPAAVRRRLAAFLNAHATRLQALADELNHGQNEADPAA